MAVKTAAVIDFKATPKKPKSVVRSEFTGATGRGGGGGGEFPCSEFYHAFILGQSLTAEITTQEGVLLELPLEQEVERIRLAGRK